MFNLCTIVSQKQNWNHTRWVLHVQSDFYYNKVKISQEFEEKENNFISTSFRKTRIEQVINNFYNNVYVQIN